MEAVAFVYLRSKRFPTGEPREECSEAEPRAGSARAGPGEGPEGLGLGGAVPARGRPGMPPGKQRSVVRHAGKANTHAPASFSVFSDIHHWKKGLPFRGTAATATAMHLLHHVSFIIKTPFLIHMLKISLFFFFF